MDIKKNYVICTLYEERSHTLQNYSYEQQMNLKEGLVQRKLTCGFARIFPGSAIQNVTMTHFGAAPKGNILSYQSLENEKLDDRNKQ